MGLISDFVKSNLPTAAGREALPEAGPPRSDFKSRTLWSTPPLNGIASRQAVERRPPFRTPSRVAEMAEQLQALTNAASKTEAVGKALERAIEDALRELLAPELERAVAIARQIGRHDDQFDQKAFSDEMWGL